MLYYLLQYNLVKLGGLRSISHRNKHLFDSLVLLSSHIQHLVCVQNETRLHLQAIYDVSDGRRANNLRQLRPGR